MFDMNFVRKEFHDWATHVLDLGFTDFVTPEDGFATEIAKNQKWKNATASDIYVWITENEHSYVGQAVNVRNRLRQHWKNYRDIAYAAFQSADTSVLNSLEKELIGKMERRFPSSTLNIKFAASSAKTVPFDLIVSATSTEKYLSGEAIKCSRNWQVWPLLENKKLRNFQKFKDSEPSALIFTALRRFVESCIPDPQGTEVKFWSVSLLYPQSLILRVNVGQQEVFTLHVEGNQMFARILSKIQLSSDFEYPAYQTMSYINFVELEQFDQWLTIGNAIECRKLIVWLMRHTVPLNSGSHCPQLVRAAFGR